MRCHVKVGQVVVQRALPRAVALQFLIDALWFWRCHAVGLGVGGGVLLGHRRRRLVRLKGPSQRRLRDALKGAPGARFV